MLDRSLPGLRELIDRALVEVRVTAGIPDRRERMTVMDFINDVQIAASLDAAERGLELLVAPIDDQLTIDADRHIFAGAVANLLQNVHPGLLVRAYAAAGRI